MSSLEEAIEMEPEVYFIKYAYPCAHILWKVRKDITGEEYRAMYDAAVNNKVMGRDYLEKVFVRAFARMRPLAEEMKKDDVWDVEVIREYFVERHNAVLSGSDYPESFKEMCKTYEAEVVSLEGNEALVRYESEQGGEKKRKVRKDYLPDLKSGERVMIHWQYAIEKVD